MLDKTVDQMLDEEALSVQQGQQVIDVEAMLQEEASKQKEGTIDVEAMLADEVAKIEAEQEKPADWIYGVPTFGDRERRFRQSKRTPEEERQYLPAEIGLTTRREKRKAVTPGTRFEKAIDPVAQGLMRFVNAYGWNVPELLNRAISGEELPEPKTDLGGVVGGAGELAGVIKGPFKAIGGVLGKAKPFTAVPKTKILAALQNIGKQAGTLGVAGALTEHGGETIGENLEQRGMAFLGGTATGTVFGSSQFANFTKLAPLTNFIIRFGINSGALDVLGGRNPFDDRSTLQKTFDYGLNAYFSRHGFTPEQYKKGMETLQSEKAKIDKQAERAGEEKLFPNIARSLIGKEDVKWGKATEKIELAEAGGKEARLTLEDKKALEKFGTKTDLEKKPITQRAVEEGKRLLGIKLKPTEPEKVVTEEPKKEGVARPPKQSFEGLSEDYRKVTEDFEAGKTEENPIEAIRGAMRIARIDPKENEGIVTDYIQAKYNASKAQGKDLSQKFANLIKGVRFSGGEVLTGKPVKEQISGEPSGSIYKPAPEAPERAKTAVDKLYEKFPKTMHKYLDGIKEGRSAAEDAETTGRNVNTVYKQRARIFAEAIKDPELKELVLAEKEKAKADTVNLQVKKLEKYVDEPDATFPEEIMPESYLDEVPSIYDVIADAVGKDAKIKPSRDYPDLSRVVRPGRMSKKGISLDEIADSISRATGRDYDVEMLYAELEAEKFRPVRQVHERIIGEEPTPTVTGKEWRPEATEWNKKVKRLGGAFDNFWGNKKQIYPRNFRKWAAELNYKIPDEAMQSIEQEFTDRYMLSHKPKGYAETIINRLVDFGVRKSIAEKGMIDEKYQLGKMVKVKREANGEISAVIYKSQLEELVPKLVDDPNATNFAKRFAKSIEKTKLSLYEAFVVPQYYFRRLGMGKIYNIFRQGERNEALETKDLIKNKLNNIFGIEPFKNPVQYAKNLLSRFSIGERERIGRHMATRQEYGADMELAGVDPLKFGDLTTREKKAVMEIDKFIKPLTGRIAKQAHEQGIDIGIKEGYFPMYNKSDIVAEQGVDYDYAVRKHPFFKSILERKPETDFNNYEMDAYKTMLAWTSGASRYLNVGSRSVPLKYLIHSKEFTERVGPDVAKYTKDLFSHMTSPKDEAFPPLKFLRKMGYRSYLGLNPIVMMKQAVSYLDVMMMEKLPQTLPKEVREMVRKLPRASVIEREPGIEIADMKSLPDRLFLGGIGVVDRFFANHAFNKMIAVELGRMYVEGEKLNTKSVRTAIRNISDRLDFAMSGVTPAQRPKAYRTELGKAVLMFTSTINSRLQYYIENSVNGIKGKDAEMLARAFGGFLMGGYAEAAMSRLGFGEEDIAEMAKETGLSAVSNIPTLGAMMYFFESGDYDPSPVLKNIKDAFRGVQRSLTEKEGWLTTGFKALEVATGLPKQIRKTFEGYEVIREGKRISRTGKIEVDRLGEQIRALMRGQYGPLDVKEHYRQKEQKARWNSKAASIFSKSKNTALTEIVKKLTPSKFWGEDGNKVWKYANQLYPDELDRFQRLLKRAEREGVELSATSILQQIKND